MFDIPHIVFISIQVSSSWFVFAILASLISFYPLQKPVVSVKLFYLKNLRVLECQLDQFSYVHFGQVQSHGAICLFLPFLEIFFFSGRHARQQSLRDLQRFSHLDLSLCDEQSAELKKACQTIEGRHQGET